MLRYNGVRSVANCKDMQSLAARRFFGVFYRWSRAGCLGQTQNVSRNLHTNTRRNVLRPSVTVPNGASSPVSQIRHRYKATTIDPWKPEPAAPESTSPQEAPKVGFREKRKAIRKLRQLQKAAANPSDIRSTEDEGGTGDETVDSINARYKAIKMNLYEMGKAKLEREAVRRAARREGDGRSGKRADRVRESKKWSLRAFGLPNYVERRKTARREYFRKQAEEQENARPTLWETTAPEKQAKTSEGETDITEEEIEDLTGEKPETPKISQNLRKVMRALPASVVVVTTSLSVTAAPEPRRLAYQSSDGSFRRQPSGLELNARGMTISSFTTLTLTPYPIIQFNIKAPSRTLDALMETRHFLVHILEATKAGAKVAAAFTKGNVTGPGGTGSPFVDPEAFKVKPTRVEFRQWITNKDGTYIQPTDWKLKAEEDRAQWIPEEKGRVKRPSTFVPADAEKRKPVQFGVFPIADRIKAIEEKQGAEVLLPRLASDGVLRTLHCKVLDRGQRGGRGDGFVTVGDHVMVLAQVHDIIGSTPVEEISQKHQEALAYSHGNFTGTKPIVDPYAPEEEEEEEADVYLERQREEIRRVVREHPNSEVDKKVQTQAGSSNYSSGGLNVPDNDLRDALIATGRRVPKVPKEEKIQQGDAPVIRKIASKGVSLREISELANYYAHKAIEIRKDLPFEYNMPGNPAIRRPLLQESKDAETPLPHEGPRIIKHVSMRGALLEDIREQQKIAEEFEIPRRLAQEAIEELPDADAQARKEYALLKAAEELAARKEEIVRVRAKQSSADDDWDSGKRRKHAQDLKEPQLKIHKYKMTGPPPDSELQPKMEQVWEKIERFKRLQHGLKQAYDAQEGLFWRPQEVVKNYRALTAKEEAEKNKRVDLGSAKETDDVDVNEDEIKRWVETELRELSDDPEIREWQERELAWKKDSTEDDELKKWEESELAIKEAEPVKMKTKKGKELSNRAKKKLAKEERARERETKYQGADPWAEEFS